MRAGERSSHFILLATFCRAVAIPARVVWGCMYSPNFGGAFGQGKAVRVLTALRDRSGFAGRSFWISGQSGSGKTTVARLIAAEVADDWMTDELDAGDLTPARLRTLETTMHLCAPGKGGRTFLINEAHGMRRDTVRQLLVLLERQQHAEEGVWDLPEGGPRVGPTLSDHQPRQTVSDD